MSPITIVSPEDQKVTFIEVFFDLVFVFSVTQAVRLLHDGFDGIAIVQAIVVFRFVWRGWTQFTWSLNAADTTHPIVQLGVLMATGVALFMAIAVPEAFGGRSLWFAVTYALVRTIGMALYYLVALENLALRSALRTFIVLSSGGLLAVLIGGFIGGTAQYWLWGLAIILDFVNAGVSGQADVWNLHPEHFAERHGSFVIIALGETLIVAASGITYTVLTSQLLIVAVLAVAITGGFWWIYFPRAMPTLEHALASSHGSERSKMARDSYSIIHFLMLAGVIASAAAIEEAIAHPTLSLPRAGTVAFALGIILFVGGMAAALWRATGTLPLPRVIVSIVTGIVIVGSMGVDVMLTLGFGLLGIIAIGVLEQRT
ncbi:MAG: low temperature requirement protein A [Chloroflexi bacterium]|nr:low temperature requirement protein A [Chloroflexota bacterium]